MSSALGMIFAPQLPSSHWVHGEASDEVQHCAVAEQCGGCPLIGLSERAQQDRKLSITKAALSRVGLVFPEPRWVPSQARVGYRNRVRLRIDPEGTLGFFNPGKANDCSVLEPGLALLVARIKEFALSQPESLQRFAHVEVRSPDADAIGGACFSRREETVVQESTLQLLHDLGPDVLISVKGAVSPEAVPRQRRMLADDVYCYVPLDAFVQVNTSVNRSLCAALRALAASHDVASAIDLYAGSGNLTLPLLRDGISAVAIESQASAAHALRLAAETQRLGPLEVICREAAPATEVLLARGRRCDLLIVDAPRAGVRKGLERMAKLASRHVALISCNPESLARDLAVLSGFGFSLRELLLFDMFAQTQHIEVLAWLSRD